MAAIGTLAGQWDRRRLLCPYRPAIEITDNGILLGRGTVLARMDRGSLSFAADAERLRACLSILERRPVSPAILTHFEAAVDYWDRGEKALANLRLVFARLPRLEGEGDAYRLFLADRALAGGISPRDLLKELGLDATPSGLSKYDGQPRVPAGNGRNSGRFGSDGGGAGAAPNSNGERAFAPASAARSVAGTLLEAMSAERLAALAAFAARLSGPAAVLGALFVPNRNSGGVTEGTLPDHPGIRYRADGPAGTVHLSTTGSDGSQITVRAVDRGGLYVDTATNAPIGRNLGGQLYFDFDAVQDAIGRRDKGQLQTGPAAEPQSEEPKLCPAPGPDRRHGSSDRAKDYEDDVHLRVNPLAPLPREFAVLVTNPKTGESAYFDDCFRYAGDLIDRDMKKGDLADAKSERFGYLLTREQKGVDKSVLEKLEKQAARQWAIASALGVNLKWYFESEKAANKVRKAFANKFPGMVIAYMPARKRR